MTDSVCCRRQPQHASIMRLAFYDSRKKNQYITSLSQCNRIASELVKYHLSLPFHSPNQPLIGCHRILSFPSTEWSRIVTKAQNIRGRSEDPNTFNPAIHQRQRLMIIFQ